MAADPNGRHIRAAQQHRPTFAGEIEGAQDGYGVKMRVGFCTIVDADRSKAPEHRRTPGRFATTFGHSKYADVRGFNARLFSGKSLPTTRREGIEGTQDD
jgi:hypothetical protein